MLKTQRIIWTALPNGLAGSRLKLSVFVSPRLYIDSNGALSDFPDFANWPDRVNAVKFSVEFQNGPRLPATVSSNKADRDLWKTVFPANTFVRLYKFPDHSQRTIRSYPVSPVMTFLKGLYTNAGEKSPTHLPRLQTGRGEERYFGLNQLVDKLGTLRQLRIRPSVKERAIRFHHATEALSLEERLDSLLRDREVKAFAPHEVPAGMTAEQFAFVQLDFFYDRTRNKNLAEEQSSQKPTPRRLPRFDSVSDKLNPQLDFHQMLASVGDYPELERRLGLVIDLEVPVPANTSPASLLRSDSNQIRLRPEWTSSPSAFNNDFAPWTALLVGKFRARPNTSSDLSNGMLKLANVNASFLAESAAEFDLLQVDVDGASQKALDLAHNTARLLNLSPVFNVPSGGEPRSPSLAARPTPELGANAAGGSPANVDGGLPAFRTSGLALVKRARAFNLANFVLPLMAANNRAAENSLPTVDQNLPVLLFADDLVRGYRVDIWDKNAGTPVWRSLCKRIGRYSFPNPSQPPLTISDEGYVKGPSATSTVDGDNDDDLYLHETMFQWDGWSLSAPRPGKTLVPHTYDSNGVARPTQEEKVEHVSNTASGIPGVNLETSFSAQPGTLPRLRFGHSYRMRVRAADLAGNSLPPELTDDSQASQEHLYTRFEPVIPPALALRDRLSDGESVERMVIRSNYDQKVSDYIVSPGVKEAISNKEYKYHEANERHIAPPKTSQQMAELHGKFDDFIGFDAATGAGKDYDRGYKLALKESGTFLDTEVYDPQTNSKQTVSGIELVTPASVPASPPPPTLPLNPPGRALSPGQYVIHKEDNLLLPYLPDPFARGVALVGIPGVSGNGPLASDPGAVKIELVSLDPADETVKKFSVLQVRFDGEWPDRTPFRIRIVEGSGEPVWQSHVLTVFLPKATIARLRYSSYLEPDDLKQMGVWQWISTQPQLAPYAHAGQHWLHTPFRQMELVHAVQQPLTEPRFDKMQTVKLKIGDTFAVFRGNVDISVKSTGKFEVLAQWKEWIDSLAEPGPRQLSLEGRAFELKIEENAPDVFNVESAGGANVPRTPPPTGLMVLPRGAAPTARHEFHDTKYRAVDYSIVATTRFREYFPPEIADDPRKITRKSAPQTFKVLNSARPAAPKVLYVVPTFKWDPAPSEAGDRKHQWAQKAGSKQLESRRIGGGLRVYLERPWYSSGDEEKLGVVLREAPSTFSPIGIRTGIPGTIIPNASAAAPNDPLKPFVTQWGMDPVWDSELPKASPRFDDFKLASASMSGLTLDELGGVTVGVAGHEVEYDSDRKLWFCDIEIDAGHSYYPFVRMALARFQPNSIPNAHLSRVVLADFVQLAPDRTTSVTFGPENILLISVTGSTYRASSIDAEAVSQPGTIMVRRMTPEAEREAELAAPVWQRIRSRTRGGGEMWASLETQMIGTDLGWVPVPKSDVRLSNTAAGVWVGRMQLRPDYSHMKLRLVIREYEWFIADPKATRIDKRIVYADVLEL